MRYKLADIAIGIYQVLAQIEANKPTTKEASKAYKSDLANAIVSMGRANELDVTYDDVAKYAEQFTIVGQLKEAGILGTIGTGIKNLFTGPHKMRAPKMRAPFMVGIEREIGRSAMKMPTRSRVSVPGVQASGIASQEKNVLSGNGGLADRRAKVQGMYDKVKAYRKEYGPSPFNVMPGKKPSAATPAAATPAAATPAAATPAAATPAAATPAAATSAAATPAAAAPARQTPWELWQAEPANAQMRKSWDKWQANAATPAVTPFKGTIPGWGWLAGAGGAGYMLGRPGEQPPPQQQYTPQQYPQYMQQGY